MFRLLPKGKKSEFIRRFEGVEKPENYFQEFFAEAFEEKDFETAEALLQSYVKRFPNRPDGPFCAAFFDLRDQKVDQAVAKFTESYRLAQKELAIDETVLVRRIVTTFCETQTAELAYTRFSALNRRLVFRQLVSNDSCYEMDALPDEQPKIAKAKESLKKLIDVHSAADPKDPWLGIARAEACVWAGDHAGAEKEFTQAEKQISAEDDLHYLKFRRISASCRAGKAVEAYEKIDPSPKTFQTVAYFLERKKQFDDLDRLIAVAAAKDPQPPELEAWRGHFCWHRKDYTGAARRYLALLEKDDDDGRWYLMDRLIRCLARSGQFGKARQILKRPNVQKWPTMPFAESVIAANEGNALKLNEELEKFEDDEPSSNPADAEEARREMLATVHADPDIGPALRTKSEFRLILEKFPEPKKEAPKPKKP